MYPYESYISLFSYPLPPSPPYPECVLVSLLAATDKKMFLLLVSVMLMLPTGFARFDNASLW